MGFGAIIGGVLSAGMLIYSLTRKQPQDDQMQPLGLDAFGATQNSEGQVAPLVFGTVRIPSNLLWYGGLESEPVYQESGGKGIFAGAPKAVQGYKYWLDLWHGICQGPDVTLNGVYIQDRYHELVELPVNSYTFNPGDTNDYPTEPGEYAAPLKGLAHIFFDKYLLGVNVTQAPTLHFVVTRTSNAPLTYANETNGINPAALIWELLREAEVPSSDINIPSFEAAATDWHSKGYGLNVSFDRQVPLEDHVNNILSYVDAVLRDDGEQFYLKAFTASDTADATITTDDFLEFTFARRAWDDVFTDFRATFTDANADFTDRGVRMRNSAARMLIGHDNQKSIDLGYFNDLTAANTRTWDLMKRLSYPEGQIRCRVGVKYDELQVGDVVGITHADYDMTDELYRITRKEESEYDQNSVQFELTQVLESLLDHNETASSGGGTKWVQTHYLPVAPTHQRVIELPYTSMFGDAPAYLCLASRASVEDGFIVRRAVVSGGDYATYADASRFSQYGVLTANYSADTYAIDDETGILFNPDREDPVFDSISRAALFGTSRVAVLVHTTTGAYEIVGFQTVTPIAGEANVRLTGIIRGLMNTEPQDWYVGSTEVWLTNLGDNIITGITDGAFYLKLVPYLYTETALESDCTEITANYAGVARTPWPPSLVQAVRSGTGVTVTLWPTTRLYAGAGATDGAGTTHGQTGGQTDQWPPDYMDSWNYSIDNWVTTLNSTSYTWGYTLGGAHTLKIKTLSSGYLSSVVEVAVGAGDGTYWGPEV